MLVWEDGASAEPAVADEGEAMTQGWRDKADDALTSEDIDAMITEGHPVAVAGREHVTCSCGKPFPEDGGAEGVCECCSGCSTGRKHTYEPQTGTTKGACSRCGDGPAGHAGPELEPPTHDGPCVESLDGDGEPLGYCVTCYQPTCCIDARQGDPWKTWVWHAHCRVCGERLSEARQALGLTLCSGACHRKDKADG